MDSDDDGEGKGDGSSKEESKKAVEDEDGEAPSNDEGGDGGEQQEDEKEEFGEQIQSFDFHETVFDALLKWLQVEDDDELDPADVVGFFLSLPTYEDNWMIDERVCQILFNAGGIGGDSEMKYSTKV
jgi:hypothetical protein